MSVPAENSPASTRRAVVLAGTGAAILVFALATLTQADPDLWGHLRFGLDALHAHALPSVDPYAFTADRPWINHEWLSEWQMAVAYSLAGIAGLAWLKGTLIFVTFVLVWRSLGRVDVGAKFVTLALVGFASAPLTRTLRPQLWTCVSLALLCAVLSEDRRRWFWALPVLFAAWANVHGGWIVGLGVLSAWGLVDVVQRRRAWPWLALVASCLVATLCNPYGWTMWDFLHATVGMTRGIAEWQPIWRQPVFAWVPWVAAVAATIWAASRPTPHRWQATAVLAMLAYASLRVFRLEPLFVECAGIVLAPAIASRFPRSTRPLAATPGDLVVGATIATACVAGAIWIGSTSLRCVSIGGAWAPDRQAAGMLGSAAPGRLVVFFDWGEYAIWHWGPRLRVSMDGRRETIYSDARLDEHADILAGNAKGQAVLDDWRAEYVWLPATSIATKQWLASHGYRIELDDARSFVAVRADLPRLATNGGVNAMPWCFPG